MREISVITINRPGLKAALTLADLLQSGDSGSREDYHMTIFAKKDPNGGVSPGIAVIEWYDDLDALLTHLWKKGSVLLFFLATGIVVRKIAPLLGSKYEDPAVLVMDFKLRQILPLLSGHAGGANEIALDISSHILDCRPFLTTATDQEGIFAFDLFALKNGFEIENPDVVAGISNALLNREAVTVLAPPELFSVIRSFPGFSEELMVLSEPANAAPEYETPCIILSPAPPVLYAKDCLRIRIRPIAIGCGMNRGVMCDEVETAVLTFLREHRLRLDEIRAVASFVVKKSEQGLIEFAARHSLPLVFFDEQQINAVPGNFSASRARELFGIHGVAEPCAVLASERGILFQHKQAFGGVTVAAAF